MKKHIPTLMTIYQEMVSANEKQKIKYDKEKREKQKEKSCFYVYLTEQERIYSNAMMHNLITLISKLENQK